MVKYKEIAAQILKKIDKKEYPNKLPSENELIRKFNASRNTIRSAIRLLNEQGIVTSIQGSGSYVSSSLNEKEKVVNLSKKSGLKSLNFKKINSKVINFSIINADKSLSKYLNCCNTEKIYYIERLRYSDHFLICLEYSYYLKKYVPYLSREICKNSIFQFIKKNYNLSVVSSEEFLTLHHFTNKEKKLINKNDTNNIGIQLEEINMLKHNIPFNYSKTLYFDDNLSFYCYINNKF